LPEDAALLDALRAGDEAAFLAVVGKHHASMIRVARLYVDASVAEDVVQEAWIGVLNGLDGFQGRCSLKAWIFRILANCARRRGGLERRSVPFSALEDEPEEGEPAVSPDRFLDGEHPRWPGHWSRPPEPWAEERLAAHEAASLARSAIEALPPAQRQVITLRDLEGLEASEVCELLAVSEGNQRVLLHRARSRVRAALEAHLGGPTL